VAVTPRGKFITLEGSEGSGKTTAARHLGEWLRSRGEATIVTREPGGTPLGDEVRRLVLHLRDLSDDLDPRADALLYAAARAQHTSRVILPALERGEHVISARYLDSSLAYQGLARGLGVERVLELNLLATGGLLPDRTFLIVVPPEEAAARQGGEPDRIEREGPGFAAEVDRAYRELAGIFAERVVVVDGTQNPEDIAEDIHGQLRDVS
jgi:dTMP kinase